MRFATVIIFALCVSYTLAGIINPDETSNKKVSQRLKDSYAETADRVKTMVGKKQKVAQEAMVKAVANVQDSVERLHELRKDATEQVKELVGGLRGRISAAYRKFVDRRNEKRDKRETSQQVDNVRDVLAQLRGKAQQQFSNYASAIKGFFGQKREQFKDQHERLMALAKDTLDNMNQMKKDSAREAIEALRPFKNELGNIWAELTEAAQKVLRGKKE
ncbi:hypothetical protein HDE_13800 [Halotydeus destructor]|nr:hypothetical protein HDE_13800 [Halotydeus destructor]